MVFDNVPSVGGAIKEIKKNQKKLDKVIEEINENRRKIEKIDSEL